MSYPNKARNLASAIRHVYAGPFAAKRLAADTGWCIASAKTALRGDYPKSWDRFLTLIAKRPRILAQALQTTWAEELELKREIGATRRKLDEIERRLDVAKAETLAGKKAQSTR